MPSIGDTKTMMNRKRVFWATTALFTGLMAAGAASAQSSGTIATEATEVEEVVVTGRRGPATVDGVVVGETIGKTRSSITQEFIGRQQAGQTILQSLNLIPGVNFTNNDPYGSSGGSIRLRGFDSQRISLTFDGIPLNDTGNYQIYPNQQVDPELIERAQVNQGTTDVDSPTAAATGGLINYTTSRPTQDPQVQVVSSLGEFNFGRVFLRADTGAFGPWGTTAYTSISYLNYDKFKGPGEMEKIQFNGRLYQDLGDGNFASLSGHYNRNRNAFYNNFITPAQFAAGGYLENDIACIRPVGVNGTAQNENTGSTRILSNGTTALGSCTNLHDLRINPSNTGNIRGQFSYGITDNLRFTFDPTYQFVMANGGGFTALSERDDRLDLGGPTGRDINGDGDTLDTVTIYTPSNTNTNRYSLATSLIWDVNDDHRFRVAYTVDYGRHRQTGEGARVDAFGRPLNVFAGNRLYGNPNDRIQAFNGNSFFRTRDRASIAELQQFAAEYRGQFFDDAVVVRLGVTSKEFTRELNQFCFSQNGSSTVRCTAETPTATLANGNVTFASTGTTQFIAPYSVELNYDKVLPTADVSWRFGDGHQIYAAYAETISVPRTDQLYQPVRTPSGGISFSQVQPETATNYDLGYRYTGQGGIAGVALWFNQFENRIVSSFDNDPSSEFFGQSVDRNIGDVESQGVDFFAGYEINEQWSVYGSASYIDTEISNDLFLSTTQRLPTAGKEVPLNPEWTVSLRTDWSPTENLSLGLQAKYTDDRFGSDVNDVIFPSYTVLDFDARYDLTDTFGLKDAFIQFNVTNLTDEEYQLGNSVTNAVAIVDVDPVTAGNQGRAAQNLTSGVASPRTVSITLGTTF
jgi:iron complex outermembrane receptor protein